MIRFSVCWDTRGFVFFLIKQVISLFKKQNKLIQGNKGWRLIKSLLLLIQGEKLLRDSSLC